MIINDVDFVLLLLYVDDIIIASNKESLIRMYRNIIGERFRLSHSGDLRSYLNIDIERDRSKRTISLSQEKFIYKMNLEFGIIFDPSVDTPMQQNLKLLATEEEMRTYTKVVAICSEFSVSETNWCDYIPECMYSPYCIVCYLNFSLLQFEPYFLGVQSSCSPSTIHLQYSCR